MYQEFGSYGNYKSRENKIFQKRFGREGDEEQLKKNKKAAH